MPSARSASWPNQGLSGAARHFPGLGILPQMPNSAFSPWRVAWMHGAAPDGTCRILPSDACPFCPPTLGTSTGAIPFGT